MRKDPRTLVLITVVKNLQKLGYVFQVKLFGYVYGISRMVKFESTGDMQ